MKLSPATVEVIKKFSAEERLTREGGEKLRLFVLELLKKHEVITLDLQKKPIASVSFWDEGIAKLLDEGLTPTELKNRIKFKNILPRDLEVIERVVQGRTA